MVHRHLNRHGYATAAIDDIIDRGGRDDWAELRDALPADPEVRRRVLRVCAARRGDPYAQRYHLWRQYAERAPA